MTSARRLGLTPVATHEVVEALASLLLADADGEPTAFRTFVEGGGGRLHVHDVDLRTGDDGRESDAEPFYALLWERAPGREEPEGDAGLVTVTVQLRVVADPDGRPHPHRELGHAHALAYEELQEADLGTRTVGSDSWRADTLVTRTGRPSPARRDRQGRLFSAAYYAVAVHAVPTPQP